MTGLDPQTIPNPLPDQPYDPWNFRPEVAVEVRGARLGGHLVDAIDGRLGRVVGASLAPDHSYLVVTTGWWVFRTTLQLPAGTVSHVDQPGRTVYLDRTRGQVRYAPRIPPAAYDEPAHRDLLADHYYDTYHPTARR
jgi:hypothetical protein